MHILRQEKEGEMIKIQMTRTRKWPMRKPLIIDYQKAVPAGANNFDASGRHRPETLLFILLVLS